MIAYRFCALLFLAAAGMTAGCSKSDSDSEPGDIPQFSAFKDLTEAPAPIQAAAQAVVRIQTGDSYATGSFIAADGLLLTNNHVLGVDVCPKEGCYAKITRMHQRYQPAQDPEVIFVEPQQIDVGLDMAILQAYAVDSSGKKTTQRLDTPQYLKITPRDSASLLGTHVNVVGHPEGKLKKWTSGDVSNASGTWFECTAFILPGNSGSPLLDDNGDIVGLLHRAPTTQDLVTRTGINIYSIGTASAAIQAARNAPLPPATLSLTTAYKADDVVEHQIVYLNAHVSTAALIQEPPANPAAPAEHDLLSLLGTACDKGLARTDYDSPEDLSAATEPCYDALNWIECSTDAPADGYHTCPSGDAKSAWAARFQSTFDHFRALNGQLALDILTYGPAALETSTAAGQTAAHDKLQQALSAANPPLDFTLSAYLAIYGIDNYGGTSLVDFVRNYSNVAHYELAIGDIALTAVWLNRGGLLNSNDTKALLARLESDDKADLGEKLYIEEIRYNSGILDEGN